jgi:hypothetical protein
MDNASSGCFFTQLDIDKPITLALNPPHGVTRLARIANTGRHAGSGGKTMENVWAPVPGTRFFTRNGEGLYERLTEKLYLRVDEVDETDAREVCTRLADAFEARAPVRMVA